MKKQFFILAALLASTAKAFLGDDVCFKFYAGGDLGVGMLKFQHQDTENIIRKDGVIREQRIAIDFDYDNSTNLFIGGGRFGVSCNFLKHYSLGIMGNVYSAKSCSKYFAEINGQRSIKINASETGNNLVLDSSTFLAGVHFHLGFKPNVDNLLYMIIGYAYLKSCVKYDFIYNFKVPSFGLRIDIDLPPIQTNLNNNGIALGLGAENNLFCNWLVRLESIFVKFQSHVLENNSFKNYITSTNRFCYRPKLFYCILSVDYSF